VGTAVEATSARGAAEQAGLTWHVQLAELQALALSNEGVTTLPVGGKFATVRTNADGSQSVLGTVGGRYQVFQNTEMFSALDGLVDSGDARYAYAGEINKGASVYMVMELPEGVKVKGDPHKAYLLARTSHDGSSSLQIAPIVERIHCINQISGIFRKTATYSLKHTTNAKVQVEDIRKVIPIIYQGIEEYESISRYLLGREVNDDQVNEIFKKMWSLPSEVEGMPYSMLSTGQRRQYNKAEHARQTARKIYFGATGTQENIQGTEFAAYQAIVEYIDHYSHKDAAIRAERTVNGTFDKQKRRALSLLTKGI
jgi:hypothetical protein